MKTHIAVRDGKPVKTTTKPNGDDDYARLLRAAKKCRTTPERLAADCLASYIGKHPGEAAKVWAALGATPAEEKDGAAIARLAGFEKREYTATLPITLHVGEWFTLAMGAIANGLSLEAHIASLLSQDEAASQASDDLFND